MRHDEKMALFEQNCKEYENYGKIKTDLDNFLKHAKKTQVSIVSLNKEDVS